MRRSYVVGATAMLQGEGPGFESRPDALGGGTLRCLLSNEEVLHELVLSS